MQTHCRTPEPRRTARANRLGFSLIEMLTVIAIISILVALLVPAIAVARGYARAIYCRNNLRQIGIGLASRAESTGVFCSGTFSWRYDGAVTENGWVADLVEREVPVGELLCTSSTGGLSETYADLLTMMPGDFDATVDSLGSSAETAPDGSTILNPCRQILEGNDFGGVPGAYAASSTQRVQIIKEQILEKFYNTNYTASWYLVRTEMNLDANGNVSPREATGFDDGFTGGDAIYINSLADNPVFTRGPLTQDMLGHLNAPLNHIPLMGCGRALPEATLSVDIGDYKAGEPLTKSHTRGPVKKNEMHHPLRFADGTPKIGASGWWKVWARQTLQDYTDFAPVHMGDCNILFADGSVKNFEDANSDGLLNNGFEPYNPPSGVDYNPYRDSEVELAPHEVVSYFSLLDPNVAVEATTVSTTP